MAYKKSVAQNKGGVGKTNETLNLGVELVVVHGLRVRLVDLDPQSDLSAALGFEVDREEDCDTVKEAIERAYVRQRLVEGTAADVIQECRWDVPWRDKLTFIPSRFDLEEVNTVTNTDMLLRVRAAMSGTDDDVDVVLFDCPPSLGALPKMGWGDSDDVLLITQPSFRSFRGLHRTHSEIHYSRRDLRVPELDYSGLIINGYRQGTKNHEFWHSEIIKQYASGPNEGKHWSTVPLRAKLSSLDDELLPVALMPETTAKERQAKDEMRALYRPAVDRIYNEAMTIDMEEADA